MALIFLTLSSTFYTTIDLTCVSLFSHPTYHISWFSYPNIPAGRPRCSLHFAPLSAPPSTSRVYLYSHTLHTTCYYSHTLYTCWIASRFWLFPPPFTTSSTSRVYLYSHILHTAYYNSYILYTCWIASIFLTLSSAFCTTIDPTSSIFRNPRSRPNGDLQQVYWLSEWYLCIYICMYVYVYVYIYIYIYIYINMCIYM